MKFTYTIKPSVLADYKIKITNGRFKNRTGDVVKRIRFNTPEYWKQMRHLIHQNCRNILEAQF